MKTLKRYEILQSLPTYGPMYIPVTEDGTPYYSEGFPVRFIRKNGTEWVANFKPGWTNLKLVVELKKSSNLLIIANGTCYIINPENTIPISVFGVDFSDVLNANNDRLVLHNEIELTVIEPNGDYWNTERISWDGIKELQIIDNNITGLSYDPMNSDEWIPFKYNIDTRILEGGSYPRYFPQNNKKPWWKIWR
jgi:hypothetical protein